MNKLSLEGRIETAPLLTPAAPEVVIRATEYDWRDPATIPLRPWVYGRQLLRGAISLVIAPGGSGKSALMTGMALALATGRDLLNVTVWSGKKRVWLWNLEDSGDELARSLQAAALRWGVAKEDVKGLLFVDSGLDGAELKLATVDRTTGVGIVRPVVEALVAELKVREIDVLVVDPFVSSHSVPENDNGAIDAVAKEWAKIAERAGCAIVLVHHSRKLNGQELDADSARGASALVAAARHAMTLSRMTKEEAQQFGIEPQDRGRFVRADAAKSNRAPAGKAIWYQIEGVALGNAEGGGDEIPVMAPWSPPDAFEGISVHDLYRVQKLVDQGNYRHSSQAADWVGYPVAALLGIDGSTKAGKARVGRILGQWVSNGALKVLSKKDNNRAPRPFVVVGEWAQI
jgi:AAA domain